MDTVINVAGLALEKWVIGSCANVLMRQLENGKFGNLKMKCIITIRHNEKNMKIKIGSNCWFTIKIKDKSYG